MDFKPLESKILESALNISENSLTINDKWNTIIDKRDEDPNFVGFQYVSFIIDGDDILFLSRTAYNSPHNFHDSNQF